VLGEGEIGHALTVQTHAVSGAAREKIESAGGTVELVTSETVSGPESPVP
jgi:large subunit ribosomal protein L15